MKYAFAIFFAFLCNASLAQNKFNPVLKRQLDSIYTLDQKYRAILSDLMTPGKADSVAKANNSTPATLMNKYSAMQGELDTLNTIFVEKIFARYSYPGKSLVGGQTQSVAFMVIQHSKKIPIYISLIKNAAEHGELPFLNYAYMIDRYLMFAGKEQLYGTQAACRNLKTGKNECFIWPVKDAKNVNTLRKMAGFENTVEDNAKNLDIVYRVITLDEIKL